MLLDCSRVAQLVQDQHTSMFAFHPNANRRLDWAGSEKRAHHQETPAVKKLCRIGQFGNPVGNKGQHFLDWLDHKPGLVHYLWIALGHWLVKPMRAEMKKKQSMVGKAAM